MMGVLPTQRPWSQGEIEMDYRKAFEVAPGEKLRLSKIDPSHTGAHESHETAEPEIRRQVERIDKLQELLYAEPGRTASFGTSSAA
jgi:hypothetical protein